MTKKKINPFVTNNAILRFIERHMGIDVEQIRELIGEACYDAVQEGKPAAGALGIEFMIEGNVVKTCLPPINERVKNYCESKANHL